MGAKTPQESQSVHQWHAQIQNDGVRMTLFGLAKTHLGVHRGADVVALQTEHSCEGLGNALVIVYDEDPGRFTLGHEGGHAVYCNRRDSLRPGLTDPCYT